ncbi:DUF1345 domain-containing protein [Sphingomonas kyeonggiensis]|uniref:Putative membrane protein n=1 Tax=Sphingomonas kyeonggiensis TaxID=1268553 RepID=A0A7W6JV82_9SPHN|nr:DUF1345 domain-containing protein [Sphingomonas kyeonggiensis]MBB4100182.1 putative membrane protein [Sphingomonas kyeonggiensis]
MSKPHRKGIGNIIAPPRFLLFIAVTVIAGWLLLPRVGPHFGIMLAFDAGAAAFLLSAAPLLGHRASGMRESACRNDANRPMLLLITVIVGVAVFTSIAAELMSGIKSNPWALPAILGTLALSWTFSNTIYALHYAHIFYTAARGGADSGGLEFPDTKEPDYWDFLYFAICLGMTFQTSDVTISSRRLRRVVTAHCLAAFVFNLGILAFTINVLGG